MEINIKKARIKDALDCMNCVKKSLLWDAYFKDKPDPSSIKEAIRRKEIYVALNQNDKCIGFMGIVENGCFGNFQYLSILSVKKRYRNKEVGKLLLNKFEQMGFKKADRIFVLCSDFNVAAQKFYKRNDYFECGKIRDLFKKGISEHLFVKYKS